MKKLDGLTMLNAIGMPTAGSVRTKGMAIAAALMLGTSLTAGVAHADFNEGMRAYVQGQYQKSLDTWTRYALAGDIRSKKVLGDVYSGKPLEGVRSATSPLEEIPVDNVSALTWYTLAAYHNFSSYQAPSSSEMNDKIIAEQRLPEIRERMSSSDVSKAQKRVAQKFESGSGFDLYNLGRMYQRGAGLPKDNVRALQMFALAKARGAGEASAAYEKLEKLMTSIEKKRANELVATWQPPLPLEYTGTTAQQDALDKARKELNEIKRAQALERVSDIDVELIQRALNALGFRAGTVDNELGQGTRAAIRRFQYSTVARDKDMTEDQKREIVTGSLTALQTVELFNDAAQSGHPMSQYVYGVMHVSGIGVERNGAIAVDWLTKAADQNLAISHNALGVIFRDGTTGLNEIQPEQSRSAFHFAKAAALGYKPANKSLEKLSFESPRDNL